MNTIALLDNLDKPLGVKFGGWDETLDYIGLHGFAIPFETSFWVVKLLKTQFWGHIFAANGMLESGTGKMSKLHFVVTFDKLHRYPVLGSNSELRVFHIKWGAKELCFAI